MIHLLAKTYGWTVEYIENLEYCKFRNLVMAIKHENMLKERELKKAQRKAKRR